MEVKVQSTVEPILCKRVPAHDWYNVVGYADESRAISGATGVVEVKDSARICRDCLLNYAGVLTTKSGRMFCFNLKPENVLEKLTAWIGGASEIIESIIVGGGNMARPSDFVHPFAQAREFVKDVTILDENIEMSTAFGFFFEPKGRGFVYYLTPQRRIRQRAVVV